MSVRYGVPAPAARNRYFVDSFRGVNFTDSEGLVDETRSPDAPNMIRDVPGKVRKCMGYERMGEYAGSINGYHERRGDTEGLIHAGTRLYKGEAVVYEGMADRRSRSFQMGSRLCILDGKALLIYDGERVQKATEAAYIPTLTIAKRPAGGGEDYEALNLLQPKYRELFAGDGSSKVYQLSFESIDTEGGQPVVEVEVLNSEGSWVKQTYGTHYTANAATGQITFVTAPGSSPVTGEDNVRITAKRTVSGYSDRINHCDIGILFGVAGNADRLFVSGNTDEVVRDGVTTCYRNYDWYSGQNDPTYWPDTGYSVIGSSASAVMGYTIISNYLATIKDDKEPERNIVVRRGDLVDGEPAFPIINTMQGPGAVGKWSGAYLKIEPMFLTRLGVYAVTTSDISGEKYSQNRSYYLDGRLREEPGLEEAFGFVYNDLYWLCLNGVAYILDGLQPLSTDRSAPYSNRQYAGFYRTNLPARVMWEKDGRLWFGSSEGRVYRFYGDPSDPGSYNDDGEAIEAYWTTGYIYGQFERNKIFRRVSVMMDSSAVSGIRIELRRNGVWETAREESEALRFFCWSYLQWGKFCWSGDPTPRTLVTKAKLKRTDKGQYRFGNTAANEAFSLLQYAVEFSQGSYYKG